MSVPAELGLEAIDYWLLNKREMLLNYLIISTNNFFTESAIFFTSTCFFS